MKRPLTKQKNYKNNYIIRLVAH